MFSPLLSPQEAVTCAKVVRVPKNNKWARMFQKIANKLDAGQNVALLTVPKIRKRALSMLLWGYVLGRGMREMSLPPCQSRTGSPSLELNS